MRKPPPKYMRSSLTRPRNQIRMRRYEAQATCMKVWAAGSVTHLMMTLGVGWIQGIVKFQEWELQHHL